MERFRTGQLSAQRNWLPGILVNILKTPSHVQNVRLLDAPFGVLCVMNSPDFRPIRIRPLEFAAVGSGETVVSQIGHEADWIFASDVGNDFAESTALGEAVAHFIRDEQIESVGGLYPAVKIDSDGSKCLGYSSETTEGERISLECGKDGRRVQIDSRTGHQTRLRYPWEIDFSKHVQDDRFDEVRIY